MAPTLPAAEGKDVRPMHNHEPPGYDCPFCRIVRTGESALPLEIVHRYEEVLVAWASAEAMAERAAQLRAAWPVS